MIPKGWKQLRLGECCIDRPRYGANTSALPFSVELPRYLRITDIAESGTLREENKASITREDASDYMLEEGDIVFARTGATVGKTYLHNNSKIILAYAGYLIRFRPDPTKLLPQYLKLYAETDLYWSWVQSTSRAGAQPNINAAEYSHLVVPCPPLPEQEALVNTISAWNSHFHNIQRLIFAKQLFKKALMQQLLTGQCQPLKLSKQKWKEISLAEFLVPISRNVPKPQKPFMSLGIRSHGKGIFHKPNFEPDAIALEELYEVKADDLIVNITFAWEGAIALAKEEDDGALVSHRFPTYRFRTDIVLPNYFKHVILQKRFTYELGVVSPGGAGRNRVLNKKDFLKIRVLVPCVEEQGKVASALDTCDREITLLQVQAEALNKQKRGLMQKLLTGQIRVKGVSNGIR